MVVSFRTSFLTLAVLLVLATLPVFGQAKLRQVIPYSFSGVKPDTAYFYSGQSKDFAPYWIADGYFGFRFSGPTPRIALGLRSTYSAKNKWFLHQNFEYSLNTSALYRSEDVIPEFISFPFAAIKAMAGFNGSIVYSKSYARKIDAPSGNMFITSKLQGNTVYKFGVLYERERTTFSTWRAGVTQEINTRGGYSAYNTNNKALGYRYQALRGGIGKVAVESVVYKLHKTDRPTTEIKTKTTYIDVLIPVASQTLSTGILPSSQRDQERFLPGIELGSSLTRSSKGFKNATRSVDFFAGIHGVQHRGTFSVLFGIRRSIYGVSGHGKK